MPRRLKSLHAPLPLAGGLVRVLGTVVEVAMLPMFHPRKDLPLRGAIALQLIRDDHSRDILTAFEELAEELLGSLLIPPPLHQDVEHLAVLIQVPFVAWSRPAPPQGIGIGLAKLAAPLADRFIRYEDTTDAQELFDVAMAEREAEIEPDRVANDLAWESMILVGISGGRGRHKQLHIRSRL
jgi:hypothetical protein